MFTKDPSILSMKNYQYDLPEERIAKFPLAERDGSKILFYDKGHISEDFFKNIADHIPANALLVFNDSKVLNARLLFQKSTGGTIEVFCLEQKDDHPDINLALQQKEKISWHCLVGGASKWKRGQILTKEIDDDGKKITLHAAYAGQTGEDFIVDFSWSPADLSFSEILQLAGAIPLPPYFKRDPERSDQDRYQTIYAATPGSVAAPTAGLHFTPELLSSLAKKNILTEYITLHVGAGTFKPVTASSAMDHVMHAEWIDISITALENILDKLKQNIVAVGTTSLRTLESLYWLGVKTLKEEKDIFSAGVSQWEAYQVTDKNITARESLSALRTHLIKNNMKRLLVKTRLMIIPGYPFKIANGLITNFHLPQSSLLLLVAAFTGGDWRPIYDYALKNDFRFLSYGDGSLLWRNAR